MDRMGPVRALSGGGGWSQETPWAPEPGPSTAPMSSLPAQEGVTPGLIVLGRSEPPEAERGQKLPTRCPGVGRCFYGRLVPVTSGE